MTDLVIALAIVFAGLVYIIARQQQMIDRLTDKLMARDYGEYSRHKRPIEDDSKPSRKPMSFYDDTSIDDDKTH